MRNLLSLVFIAFSITVFAQDGQFQRSYPVSSDRDMFNVAVSSSGQGGYYMMDYFSTMDIAAGIQISKLSPKGDVLWSYDYKIEEFESYSLHGDIVGLGADGCMFSVSNSDDLGGLVRKIVVSLDNNGEVNWTRSVGSESNFIVPGTQKIISDNAGGAYFFNNSSNEGMNQASYASRIDSEGNLMWDQSISTSINGTNMNTFMDGAAMGVDSSLLVTGTIGQSNIATLGSFYISKMDTLGNPMWLTSYSPELPAIYLMDNYDISSGPDSTIWVVGRMFAINGDEFSYIVNTDQNGEIRWAKNFSMNDSINRIFTYPLKVEHLSDGNAVVVLKFSDNITGEAGEVTTKIDSSGNPIWVKKMSKQNSAVFVDNGIEVFPNTNADLAATEDGGFVYTTWTNEAYPYVLKATSDGGAFCEEELTGEYFSDVTFITTTPDLTQSAIGTLDTLMTQRESFDAFDVPVANLLDTFYCPDDPINLTLDATQPNAISYLWETGETTAMLNVTADDSYRVTVTFDSLVCWTLCDTATISRFDEPNVGIFVDDSNLCESGLLDLVATPEGPPPYSFEWSTMETEGRITVDGPGDYGVTVTDGCGLVASSSISLNAGDFNTDLNLSLELGPLMCMDGEKMMTLFISDPSNEIVSANWSNGAMGDTITITESGLYIVNVIDVCGNELERELFVFEEDISQPFSFGIDIRGVFCFDGMTTVVLDVADLVGEPFTDYQWNLGLGDVGPTVTVIGPGTYTVSATDVCGTEFTAEINLVDEDFMEDFDYDVTVGSLSCVDGTPSIELTAGNFTNEIQSILWSTGDTSATIIVTEPGEYTVVVLDDCNTEVEKVITIELSDLMLPFEFEIAGAEKECDNGMTTITLSVINIVGDPISFTWSNGDMGEMTNITEAGDYSVTGVDICGTSFTAEYTVEESDLETEITLNFELIQGALECGNGMSSITISVDSINGGDIISYEWSNGSTDSSFTTTVPGEYTLTATDICGNQITESITLDDADFDSLFDIPFILGHWYLCEDNSINVFTDPLDLQNVFSYEWTTGETTPGINVTTPGFYNLTVTDLCGDTYFASYEIENNDFQLEFGLQWGLICEPRGFDITVSFQTSDISAYEWSDGSDGDRLFVTQPGDYSLTLTDNCGNETVESIDIPNSALPVDLEPSIVFDCFEEDCATVRLCAEIADNLVPLTLEWTGPNGYVNNENCIFLTVAELGDYTLTVTNECDPFIASYDLTTQDFECLPPVELTGSIFFDCLPDDSTLVRICAANDLNLVMSDFVWQTPNGEMTSDCLDLTNTEENFGTYTLVSFIAECNEYSVDEDFELTESSFLCGEKPCLRFPNVFFPGKFEGDERNLTFGPIQPCPIEDYTLQIFNRWGKKLFETDTLDDEWNGTYDGKKVINDVYMFVATWTDFDGEIQKAKGDITLIR